MVRASGVRIRSTRAERRDWLDGVAAEPERAYREYLARPHAIRYQGEVWTAASDGRVSLAYRDVFKGLPLEPDMQKRMRPCIRPPGGRITVPRIFPAEVIRDWIRSNDWGEIGPLGFDLRLVRSLAVAMEGKEIAVERSGVDRASWASPWVRFRSHARELRWVVCLAAHSAPRNTVPIPGYDEAPTCKALCCREGKKRRLPRRGKQRRSAGV